MKRILSLSVCLWALCFIGAAQNAATEWTSILSNQPERIRTQLISSSENSIQVNVQVPGFYSTNVQTPKGKAKVITMPKAVSTAQAGEPDLPMTGIPAIIGDHARMDIRVLHAEYMDFEGIEVAPSKGDFPRSIDPATVPYTYGECYSQDAFFPSSNVGLYEPYIVRDFRGQNMVVYPYAYNPVSKTLRVYYDMTIEMYKVDDHGANVMETRRSNTIKMDQDFKSMYQRHFINYQAAMNRYTPLDEEGDLLIICYDNFISSMTDFVNWKKTRGINTTIVGTSTTGTTASDIKSYIQSQYNANNNITHVLLVGDVAQIPGNQFSAYVSSQSDYSGYSDNLYGQIVGNDIYNDVIIGRFSASTAARVTTQANRAITYERDLTTSASWLQKGVGISRKEEGSGHNNEDDYQHMDNIRTDLLNYGYTTVTQRYANLTGYDASATTISSDINSGVGIINYANHGQETAWGANYSGYVYYANSHVNALTNDNKLPFIFSVACLVGKYDHSSDCFAEAWMNATNSSTSQPTGAIGTLMSYISQPWIPPMWAQDECIDILVGNSSTSTSQKYTFGGICINGLMGIFDHYSTTDKPSLGTYQTWIVYGDPSLMVRTKTPQAMTVNHNGTIVTTDGTYSVNVSNGNGAVATITDANHNILGKATVSNGTASVNVSGNTLNVGDQLTLCVFGYNKVTYLGTIEVVSDTEYTISTNVNPANSGTVTGAGTYYENTECTLTATANHGFAFDNWTLNGNVVSTDAAYTFTVTGGATYTANFLQLTEHHTTYNPQQEHGTISVSTPSGQLFAGDIVTLTATPDAGYCLDEWIVETVSKQRIPVVNNQFTMPDSDVTVTATFTQGFNVTLVQTKNGTISADQTTNLAPGTTVTLTATPDDGCAFVAWYVFKTGNPSDVVSVVNNQYILMPSSDVTVQAIFVAEAEFEANLGSGTSANNYIPTYTRKRYSLTQQIYLATEFAEVLQMENPKGRITKIAYKANRAAERSLTIYMAHTDKSEFSSTNDWEVMGSVAKVFEGSVDFSNSDWTVIELDTPFEYDGTSNINICVVDETGETTQQNTGFYRYNGTNRALYLNGDSPLEPDQLSKAENATRISYVSQVHITMIVPDSAESLTLSPGEMSDFSYVENHGPSHTNKLDIVGVDLQNNITLNAPTNFEISLTEDGTFASSVTVPRETGSKNRNTTTRSFKGSLDNVTITPATVYVRMKENLIAGTYSGTLTASAGTGNNLNGSVSLSGEVNSIQNSFELVIEAYNPSANPSNGWYLIASPLADDVNPANVNNMLSNTYDLYYFDQSQEKNWVNYKAGEGNANPGFDLKPGKGYLYANSGDANNSSVALTFVGTPYNDNGKVDLTYTEGKKFAGYNLIGNPFPRTAYINRDFYRMNDDHNEIIAAENATDAIDVFEGIMVIAADAIDNEVTFTTASTKSTSDADQSVVLNVVNDHGHVIDRAVVRFNKDSQLPKYMLNTSNTNISIPQHNKEYAIVKAEMQGETPVNFKAGKNDSYTLHVNTQNVEMDYLHLIDNLTGADIDLLKTPNYSFNGNVSDYASRFRLIYHANGNESNTFGFISNDEIVLMGVEGNAIVQVIDAMGRIIVSCSSDVTRISTNGMSAGVYMLRVIDDNKVKTQKIIIK